RNKDRPHFGLDLGSREHGRTGNGCGKGQKTAQTEGISQLGHQMPFKRFQHTITLYRIAAPHESLPEPFAAFGSKARIASAARSTAPGGPRRRRTSARSARA